MIPEFKVTLKEDKTIDVYFTDRMPHELMEWVRSSMLEAFEGQPITPEVVGAMGAHTHCNIKALVERGSLCRDAAGTWVLRESLIKWSKNG